MGKSVDLMDLFEEVLDRAINEIDLLYVLDKIDSIEDEFKYAQPDCDLCYGKGAYKGSGGKWWVCSCCNKEIGKELILKLMDDYNYYFHEEPAWEILREKGQGTNTGQ